MNRRDKPSGYHAQPIDLLRSDRLSQCHSSQALFPSSRPSGSNPFRRNRAAPADAGAATS